MAGLRRPARQLRFLAGEFDYFLTQQDVTRDDILNSVKDVEAEARLEKRWTSAARGDGD